MAYNQQLADRIRELIGEGYEVEEKTMFSGMCFMVNGKMCICVAREEILCRIGPGAMEAALEENGTREMINNGKTMKGYVYVAADEVKTTKALQHWLDLCLAFNKEAKAAKKKKK
jgi:TfoX/Sxy family transcriptional regulator of competence genes